jgi:hypothetical protein
MSRDAAWCQVLVRLNVGFNGVLARGPSNYGCPVKLAVDVNINPINSAALAFGPHLIVGKSRKAADGNGGHGE